MCFSMSFNLSALILDKITNELASRFQVPLFRLLYRHESNVRFCPILYFDDFADIVASFATCLPDGICHWPTLCM